MSSNHFSGNATNGTQRKDLSNAGSMMNIDNSQSESVDKSARTIDVDDEEADHTIPEVVYYINMNYSFKTCCASGPKTFMIYLVCIYRMLSPRRSL